MNRMLAVVSCTLVLCSSLFNLVLAAPAEFHHQGRLLDDMGDPVSAVLPIEFRLFDSSTDGTMLWSELHSSVTVTDGLFDASLGSLVAISPDIFASPPESGLPPVGDRYLEIVVNGEVITPRTLVVATPYAISSLRVDGDLQTGPGALSLKNGGGGGGGGGAVYLHAHGTGGTFVVSSDGSEYARVEGSDTASTVVIHSNGLPSPGHTTLLRAAPNTGEVVAIGDLNNDGIPDLVSRIASDSVAGMWLDSDSDNDDIPDASFGVQVKDNVGLSWLDSDSDDDGVPESEINSRVTPDECSVAIKTKGTGADKNRVISTSTDTSAVIQCDTDLNGDGSSELFFVGGVIPGGAVLQSRAATSTPASPASGMLLVCTPDSTRRWLDSDSDDDGVPESEIDERVMPGECSLAIKTKGTGADKNRVVITTTPDSVTTETTFDFTNSMLLPVLFQIKEKANKSKCSRTMNHTGPASVNDLECAVDSVSARLELGCDDFSGTLSTLTLQSSVGGTLDPIVHSSGALLTSGGTWTNASDANLKENFQPVDGEELLEKIEQLLIMEWNYKIESDEVKHIGPTAQDFKATFGVGPNDKTISTIDPSGIALAAIKELHRQNKVLSASNQELRDELTEIRKMLEGMKK